jgi:rod shape-determining protein MreD
MRSAAAVGVAGVLAMLLQTTIFPTLRLPIVPDLILVLTAYLGMRHGGVGGVAGAFLLGYFLDTFSGTVLGMQTLALTVAYAAVHVVARTLWTEGKVLAVGVVFLAGCVRAAATVGAAALAGLSAPVWAHVFRFGVVEAGLAALLSPFVFRFVAWEKRLLGVG